MFLRIEKEMWDTIALKKKKKEEWIQGKSKPITHKNWVVGRKMKFLISRIMSFKATVRQSP